MPGSAFREDQSYKAPILNLSLSHRTAWSLAVNRGSLGSGSESLRLSLPKYR